MPHGIKDVEIIDNKYILVTGQNKTETEYVFDEVKSRLFRIVKRLKDRKLWNFKVAENSKTLYKLYMYDEAGYSSTIFVKRGKTDFYSHEMYYPRIMITLSYNTKNKYLEYQANQRKKEALKKLREKLRHPYYFRPDLINSTANYF